MASIELYINRQLCDIDNPEKFSVYLKRQLLNPAELSTKDAQRSYDITLPATATNNQILGYINTEEVKGKFSHVYDAQLLVDSIKIFDGKFKINEITRQTYRGNLGVPAPVTISDIFGSRMMNDAGKWLVPFEGIESFNPYNQWGENPPCIFPFILYGLIPKVPIDGLYTDKNTIDETALFDMIDFPPAVNCIAMLKQIFNNAGYTLTGTATTDKKINELYVSYSNPNDKPRIYGLGEVTMSGSWTSKDEEKAEKSDRIGGILPSPKNYVIYGASKSVDIMTSSNIVNIKVKDPTGIVNQQKQIVIPENGLYKIRLKVNTKLDRWSYSKSDAPTIINHEIKLLRVFDDNYVTRQKIDNTLYKNNQPNKQGNWDVATQQVAGRVGNIYPLNRDVNFIDPFQNLEFITGINFQGAFNERTVFMIPVNDYGTNVQIAPYYTMSNPMSIKNGVSWNENTKMRNFSAAKSIGYWYYMGDDHYQAYDMYRLDLLGSNNSNFAVSGEDTGRGLIEQVTWLEKGNKLALVASWMVGDDNNMYDVDFSADFELSLTPFRRERSWITIDGKGNSTAPMNWNDTPTFELGQMNLGNMLPEKTRINDWIDGFCKTFNLSLINKGNNNFELSTRSNKLVSGYSTIIDLDSRASVKVASNESLKIPARYEFSFKIDSAEQGYVESMITEDDMYGFPNKLLNSGKTGNGIFETGSIETNTITNSSPFSYCWYKQIRDINNNQTLKVPVITDAEIWKNENDEKEMGTKLYFDKTQRFFYHNGTIELPVGSGGDIVPLAKVSNDRLMSLDYENKPGSVLNNYFMTLINNADNNYTVVDCFLTPEEYANIHVSMARFNGDLYHIAEVDGYDPSNKKQATLKLIRKTL